MKNTTIKIFMSLVFLAMLGLNVFAQNAKRIDFEKSGSPALVWEQRVPAKGSKSFVFHGIKGQILRLNFIDDTEQGLMDFGKLSVEPNAEGLEMMLDATKDYYFSVSNPTNKSTSFRISISLDFEEEDSGGGMSNNVAPDDPASENETIEFPKNDVAILQRTISPGVNKMYMFPGDKDLLARIKVTDKTNKLDVSFNKYPVKLNQDTKHKLNASGDWAIYVNNPTNKAINYTLEVSFEMDDSMADSNRSDDSDEPVFEEEQIQFASGETDTTLPQTIQPKVTKTFLFGAKIGQIVWFKVTEKTGKIDVSFNKNPVKPNVEVRQMLNASGDWAIYVSNPTNKAINYTLWIGIE